MPSGISNIDHFEVLYKNGENGRVSELARTSSWGCYVGDILFDGADDEPYIGVRSVSTDLKTYSPVEWVKVTRGDQASLPVRVDNSYGISQMDPSCDGADIARQQRYVTDVTRTSTIILTIPYLTAHSMTTRPTRSSRLSRVRKLLSSLRHSTQQMLHTMVRRRPTVSATASLVAGLTSTATTTSTRTRLLTILRKASSSSS